MLLRYCRLIVKRERVTSPVWLLCLAGCAFAFAPLFQNLFPTAKDLQSIAVTMNIPSMEALIGPVYGLEALTPAMVMAQECLLWFCLTIAIMNIFFIVRHTRGDEELGRHEVLRSLPVGRQTGAAAALLGAVALNAAISLVTAPLLLLTRIGGMTADGAFTYALAMGVLGIFFAAATLLICQLFSSARGAMAASFALLGVCFMLRAVGDMRGNALSLISPLGLVLQVYAFYENNLLPLLILLAEAAVAAGAAFLIGRRRDLGEGVIPARKGKGVASPLLLSPLGLAWRLMRGTLLGWAIAMFALGGMYGAVIGEMENFLSSNDMFKQLVATIGSGDSLVNSFIAMLNLIMGMIAAIPVINCVNRLRSEEKHGRLEQCYARAVPRTKMMLCFLLLAFAASIIMPLCSALGLYGLGHGAVDLEFAAFCKGALVYAPALWAFIGLSALLNGLLPRGTALVWALYGFMFFVNYIGRIALPEKAQEVAAKLTPFGYIPQLPVQAFEIAPLAVLTAIGLALTGAGLYGYRKRDIG